MQLFLIILGVFELLGIASAAHAIMSVRTPQGTIAWVLSLIVVPFIAVPAYWVFGRNKFDGYLDKRALIERESARLIDRTSHFVRDFMIPVTDDTPLYTSLFNLVKLEEKQRDVTSEMFKAFTILFFLRLLNPLRRAFLALRGSRLATIL